MDRKLRIIQLLILATGTFLFGDIARAQTTRTETDLLGEKQIPADAYYGVQTARALENFHGEWGNYQILS